MAYSGMRRTDVQKLEGDDVEKSIEVLDKVLSEFEDPDSLPHVVEPESPSQGNQSEDDGYMSMNGRRISPLPMTPTILHYSNHKLNLNNCSSANTNDCINNAKNLQCRKSIETIEVDQNCDSIETAQATIATEIIRIPSTNVVSGVDIPRFKDSHNKISSPPLNLLFGKQFNYNHDNETKDRRLAIDNSGKISTTTMTTTTTTNRIGLVGGEEVNLAQTTLPKIKPSAAIPSKYSSLPCSGPARGTFGSIDVLKNLNGGGGSFDDGRNVLGIGISAVHDAVLRGGVAKLPETIVNEHPVTIYPGRSSPTKGRLPPRTLPGSIEKHREVCRNANATNDSSPSSSTSASSSASSTSSSSNGGRAADPEQTDSSEQHQTISPLKRLIISKSPSSPLVAIQQHVMLQNSITSNQLLDNKNIPNCLQVTGGYAMNNKCNSNSNSNGNKKSSGRNNDCTTTTSESEEFSDDSLEGQSLPPPPPPPIVPPSPSLSAPVTPSKRGSIAWEINLDDHLPPPPPLSSVIASAKESEKTNNPPSGGKVKHSNKEKIKIKNSASAKVNSRRRGRSASGSQSSQTSTPPNSGSMSNNQSPINRCIEKARSKSMEWPEPPENLICSTEDEAASIYSDSDELIQAYPINMVGKGTYVIRKGRKERQRLSEINSSISSLNNSKLSNEESLTSGQSVSNSLLIPNSRHSIDLGSTTHNLQSPGRNSMVLSPRSRLSLDLGSPNNCSETSAHNLSIHHSSGTTTTKISGLIPCQQQQNYQQTSDFKTFATSYDKKVSAHRSQQPHFHNHQNESNGNGINNTCNSAVGEITHQTTMHGSSVSLNNNSTNNAVSNFSSSNGLSSSNPTLSGSLTRMGSISNNVQQTPQPIQNDITSTTPRRELAPPIEEDEEQDSESQSREVPLRQIENNISALLRGDICVARVGDLSHPRRPLGFRPGVHKSESAKEMLLSQNAFGPLPPSPPISSPEPDSDGFPPLPPSPEEVIVEDDEEEMANKDVVRGMPGIRITSRTRLKNDHSHSYSREELPPIVPPHRAQSSLNTLKTRSMDAGYTKKYAATSSHGNIPGTLPGEMPSTSSRNRLTSGGYIKRSSQSPRDESRMQTSCSLPETPIFARGCDIPRTPHRRVPEVPVTSGSRTAPRANTITNSGLNSSIIGVVSGSTLGGGRQRSISQALASGEMLRLSGGPARGWYPKQRTNHMRPASTENLDRLHRSQTSMRAWDGAAGISGTGSNRKPLTLPPNLTPKFFNKSPREALRRVTSLLIKKGNGKEKDSKHREKDNNVTGTVHRSPGSAGDIPITSTPANTNNNNSNHHLPTQKKKGFFKNFWKKSKHYSLDQ